MEPRIAVMIVDYNLDPPLGMNKFCIGRDRGQKLYFPIWFKETHIPAYLSLWWIRKAPNNSWILDSPVLNKEILADLEIGDRRISAGNNLILQAEKDIHLRASENSVYVHSNLDMGGKKITNLAIPENPGDAANKYYVDSVSGGGGGGSHASSHQTGGLDEVYYSQLERSSTDSTLHDNYTSTPHVSTTEKSNWNSAYSNSHTHSNKALLDSYTQSNTDIADAVAKKHSNTNDPTADQKAALAGTYGNPSSSNKYVTDTDPRMTDARTPTEHNHDNAYLKLDASNDPLTSSLEIKGNLVFEDGNRAVVADEGFSLRLKMGDAAGSTKVDFQDVNDNIVASVNSDGKGSFIGLDAGSERITSVATPTADSDAATKKYVDDNAGGMPGGSDKQIQFNDGNVFGGSENLTFDKGRSLLTIAGEIQIVGSGGWLEGWSYRQPITVSSSYAVTNCQVMVIMDTASLVTAGKLQSSCADLRFTSSDGSTLLNYWIEDGTQNTSSTKIWILVPRLIVGDTTIYCYYGNSGASAASNGEDTFIWFDDFTTSDTNWGITGGGGTRTWETLSGQNVMKIDGPANGQHIKVVHSDSLSRGEGLIAELALYASSDAGGGLAEATTLSGTFYDGWWGGNPYGWSNSRFVLCYDTYYDTANKSFTTNAWFRLRNWITASSVKSTIYRYSDEEEQSSLTKTGLSIPATLHPIVEAYDIAYFNWILVRKYIAADPTYSFGSEQTGASPETAATLNAAGLDVSGAIKVDGVQVVGEQQSSIANHSDTSGTDSDGEARARINQILAALRAHGLIAT